MEAMQAMDMNKFIIMSLAHIGTQEECSYILSQIHSLVKFNEKTPQILEVFFNILVACCIAFNPSLESFLSIYTHFLQRCQIL
mgnify:CR=1 FL=1